MAGLKNKKTKTKRIRLDAETRRRQLLKFAIASTAQNGIGQARHTEIAGQAKVAVSTVFFYFPTVDVLTNAVIDEIERIIKTQVETFSKEEFSDLPLFSQIGKFFQSFEKAMNENNDIVAVFLEWGSSIRNPMWSRYLVYRNQHIELLRAALIEAKSRDELVEGLDIDSAATMMASMLRTIFKMRCCGDKPEAIHETYLSMKNHIVK